MMLRPCSATQRVYGVSFSVSNFCASSLETAASSLAIRLTLCGSVVAELDQVFLLLLVARRQLEQARRGAAKDVVLGLLRKERQVGDRRRQVEVPVRIVGGVEQLGFRVDHA